MQENYQSLEPIQDQEDYSQIDNDFTSFNHDYNLNTPNHYEGEPSHWNWKNIAIYASIGTFLVGGFSGWAVRGVFIPQVQEIRQGVAQQNSVVSSASTEQRASEISSKTSSETSSETSSGNSSQSNNKTKYAITKDPEGTNRGAVNVRKEACSNTLVGTQSWGAVGKILNDEPVEKTCFGKSWKWYQLEWENGISGWSVDNFLVLQDSQPDLDTDVKLVLCSGAKGGDQKGCLRTDTNQNLVKIPDVPKFTPEFGKKLDDRQYILNFCYNCTTQNVHQMQVYEYFFSNGFLNKIGDYSTSVSITKFEKALDDYSVQLTKENSSLAQAIASQTSSVSSSSSISSSSSSSSSSRSSSSRSSSSSSSNQEQEDQDNENENSTSSSFEVESSNSPISSSSSKSSSKSSSSKR